MTNMLSKILMDNRNIDTIVGKMIAEKFMDKNDTVMVIDAVNHVCEEIYQEDYFLDGTRKFIRVSKDMVVFTNSTRSVEDLDNELSKYRAIKDGDYIYDVEGVVVDGDDATMWYNALWDEGDVRKNISYIADHSEWSKEELDGLDNGTLSELFWEAWYTI